MMEVAYLAGLFDGEGTIGIQKVKNGYGLRIQIQIYNKITYEIQDNFGGSAYGPYGKEKKAYIWRCNGLNAGKILELIFPYLVIKKEEAELAIDYLKTFEWGGGKGNRRTEKEKELQELYYIKMQMLKREGVAYAPMVLLLF